MKTNTLNIVENCINAIKMDNKLLLVSFISDDVLFMVSKNNREDLLYVGKERFFVALDILSSVLNKIRNFAMEVIWIVEENKAVQIIAPHLNKGEIIKQDLVIVYKIIDNKIKTVKLFEHQVIPEVYRFTI
ncbi:hypothetical protein J8281_03480 [Aquimarina sp. U1-2]|uniref:hypothetical protein n=1 Tax=Aquimarina sp. U1-2 TaxID=2823141 RepID=UPI001AECE401|nr:hypothetical protein [Aquimarina sp. U1-2]MBP2831239.1 hypothetical protein [Aquimarina sp. U1-2]